MADNTIPTDVDLGFSYEYGVDVNLGTGETEDWQRVRFISQVDPTVSIKSEDGATYEDLGADHPVKVGETWGLNFYVQQQRMADGNFLPEVEAILAATAPDANGNKATLPFRWYDKPSGGATPNPKQAFAGRGTVAVTRANNANSGIGGWNVTVTGQGPREQLATNPAAVTTPAP